MRVQIETDSIGDTLVTIHVPHDPPQRGADTGATMGIETPNPGWVALAWPATPNVMVGATAVIATSDSANGEIGVFELTAKSTAGIEEIPGAAARRLSQAAVSITEVRLQRSYVSNYASHNP